MTDNTTSWKLLAIPITICHAKKSHHLQKSYEWKGWLYEDHQFQGLLHPNSPLAHNHNAVGYPYVEQNENCKRGDKFKTHKYFQMPCKSR